jgi:hypothetical protein
VAVALPGLAGGGRAGHRVSKDIDAFIDDPQYLSILSPRLAGEGIWGCDAYDESANHLRPVFPEGEIDFIVAAMITDLPNWVEAVGVSEIAAGVSHRIEIEHPVEIAIKKIAYRGTMLKVRDIFDIVVVDSLFAQALRAELHRVAHLRDAILARLNSISNDYLALEIAELEISGEWNAVAVGCRERMREIVSAMS